MSNLTVNAIFIAPILALLILGLIDPKCEYIKGAGSPYHFAMALVFCLYVFLKILL